MNTLRYGPRPPGDPDQGNAELPAAETPCVPDDADLHDEELAWFDDDELREPLFIPSSPARRAVRWSLLTLIGAAMVGSFGFLVLQPHQKRASEMSSFGAAPAAPLSATAAPVAAAPVAPPAVTPAPVAAAPAPVAAAPAPVAAAPAPVAAAPAPVAAVPATVAAVPAPVAVGPAPVADEGVKMQPVAATAKVAWHFPKHRLAPTRARAHRRAHRRAAMRVVHIVPGQPSEADPRGDTVAPPPNDDAPQIEGSGERDEVPAPVEDLPRLPSPPPADDAP